MLRTFPAPLAISVAALGLLTGCGETSYGDGDFAVRDLNTAGRRGSAAPRVAFTLRSIPCRRPA
jgi:hypothetical protein